MAFVSKRGKVLNLWIVLLLQILIARRRRLREERIRRARARLERFRRFFQRQRSERALFVSTLGTLLTEVNVYIERRQWTINDSKCWWESNHSWSEEFWQENLRMSRNTFELICKELHSDLEKKKNFDLPLSKTVGLTLWKLATGADYQVIDNIFGVSEETASVIIQDVCEAIIDKFIDCYVRIPSADKIKETSIEFESISGIPQCVGVIDSMIIPVVPSSNNDRNVLTQILVDASYRIMNFHIANDDYFDEIFLKSSSLFQRGQEGTLFPDDVKTVNGIDVPYFVIASTACPLLPWIMTPYTKNKTMTDGKNLFNKKLENLQEVGHEAHKRLKGRWRCLQERNQRSDFVKLLIQACIILHNLCEKHGHIFNPDWSVSDETGVAHVEPVGDLYSDEAIHIRKAITDFINKNNTSKSACLKQEL